MTPSAKSPLAQLQYSLVAIYICALALLALSMQLYIGLANIPRPFEWEWTDGFLVLLSLAMLGAAPWRILGGDAWLRRKLAAPAEGGTQLARPGPLFT